MGQYQRNFWLQLFAGIIIILGMTSNAVGAMADDRELFDHAVRLSQQGDWSQAADLFSDIAERHPAWPEPKNNLAVAMLKMGKLDQAQQALEEAVGSQHSFRTAQDNRKRLYDHLAALAYDRAVGKSEQTEMPQLELLTSLALPETGTAVPAPTAAPVAEPVSNKVSEADAAGSMQQVQIIRQHLLDWSRAWSAADVDAYLSAYSRRFQPADPGKDYNQWSNIRRARLQLANNTLVQLDKISVYLAPDNKQALAQFVQSYKSDRYQDRVLKQIQLANENGQWLILSERTIEQLD